MFSIQASGSVILGGLISALPTAYFARMTFKYYGACAAKKIVNSFYKGEAMKIMLTVALFALVYKTLPIEPFGFLAGFIAAQMMIWFAPIIFDNKRQ